MGRAAFRLILVAIMAACGCRLIGERHSPRESQAPPPVVNMKPTVIDYVDTTGFDVLLEASLVNQDPVIIIRTPNDKPDWTGRLNAWIAAWNMGGKGRQRVVRGQIPVPTVNTDTVREFRLLVSALIDRAEDAARATVVWWNEDRVRSRRVDLLKQYSLRFHMGDEGHIQVIFFNGKYADHYRDFMSKLTSSDEEKGWSREYECSFCAKMLEALKKRESPVTGD